MKAAEVCVLCPQTHLHFHAVDAPLALGALFSDGRFELNVRGSNVTSFSLVDTNSSHYRALKVAMRTSVNAAASENFLPITVSYQPL